MSNALTGSEEMKTPSIRIHADLLDEFDEWVEQSDHSDRSKAVRALMRDAMGGTPADDLMPLDPPYDELLADAYRRLCRAAYPDGFVRKDTARRVCSGGAENLSKQEVPGMVLHPLRKRGYLRLQGDSFVIGKHTKWKIVGWDD